MFPIRPPDDSAGRDDLFSTLARKGRAAAPVGPLFRAPSAGAFGPDLEAPSAPSPPPWFATFDPEREAIEVDCDTAAAPRLSLVKGRSRTELRLDGVVVARFAAGTPIRLADVHLVQAGGHGTGRTA